MYLRLISFLKNNPNIMNIFSAIYNILHSPKSVFCKGVVCKGAFLNKVKINMTGNNNVIFLGPKARLNNCTISIHANNCVFHIEGKSTIIKNTFFSIHENNGKIIIGNSFTMEGGRISSCEGAAITIGDDCMFSGDINIMSGDYHSIISMKNNERINKASGISIDNHVWLAAHVCVLKGSHIPSHSVIGNSSLVTHDLKDTNCLYSGIPAKKIKENITWSRERI